ncbi:hypothetical protein BJ912DRAFT_1068847 [Pholiota molesta]|nr:hypothetical protein BJ912DRAFT_1068847 [Pholiota molesta]
MRALHKTDYENDAISNFQNARLINLDTSVDLSGKADTLILESGGVHQAVVFPSLIPKDQREWVTNTVLDFAQEGYLDGAADHTKGDYMTDSPIYGCTYLSHSNHATGHTHKRSTPSASLVKGCAAFVDGLDLLKKLAPLSTCANYLIETVDKDCHWKMVKLRKQMIERSAHVQAICAVSPALHTTLGIILNRRSGRHKDTRDAKECWSVMFVFGNFTGGEIILSLDGKEEVVTRFRSGDAIVLKARTLFHEIKTWGGELRLTLGQNVATSPDVAPLPTPMPPPLPSPPPSSPASL